MLNAYKLSKVVYFDESSVTDYIQINSGGELKSTVQLLDNSSNEGEAGIEAEIGANFGISKLFKSLVGFNVGVDVSARKSAQVQSEKLITNILQNTILTDFLSLANEKCVDNSNEKGIRVFDEYVLEVVKNSLSYMIMVTPYLTMFNNPEIENNSGLDIAMDKIDSAIRIAKGYYEFIGTKNKDRIILRFNIEGFKNNYKISDLLKMDMVMFAIKVGRISEEQLAVNKEFEILEVKEHVPSNPEYGQVDEDGGSDIFEELLVYDVLLAGIKE